MANDDEKWRAYHGTVLEAGGDPPMKVDLRRCDPAALDALAAWLRAADVAPPVAILTAENPHGRNAEDAPTPEQEEQREARNDERHARLLAGLGEAAVPWTRIDGMAPDGDYRERCVAVRMDREAAAALARRLGQLAFFWFDGRRMWLEPGLADRPREPLPVA